MSRLLPVNNHPEDIPPNPLKTTFDHSSIASLLTKKYKYFELRSKGRLYKVSPLLKDGVVWKIQYLLLDPPGTDFHLIFLRNNLLTYYQDDLKKHAFRKVIDSLVRGGFLIIGAHEKLPAGTWSLVRFSRHPHIFKRVNMNG